MGRAVRQPTEPAEKRVSLRVSRTKGEKALHILLEAKLLDHRFKVKPSDDSLLFPLLRKPSLAKLKVLNGQLGTAKLDDDLFQPKSRPPKSLGDALTGRIPRELLKELPGSYDIVGDVAIVELPSQLAPHEQELAKAIIEVNKNVKAVLAKAGTVSGIERVRPLRYLAGEHRTQTVHTESGCRFKVDIAKAYFSPRLSHEHERIVGLVQPGESIVDLFAGVGPFSIMIAKKFKDVGVDAVDANPKAIQLMQENIQLNKPRGSIKTWLGDARSIVEQQLTGKATRVIMNHPSEARAFVQTACKALRKEGGTIHYYTFAEGINCEDVAVSELKEALAGTAWRVKNINATRRVRGVAPMRWQVAVDALITPAVSG